MAEASETRDLSDLHDEERELQWLAGRGGRRQRAAAQRALSGTRRGSSNAPEPCKGKLSKHLIQEWGWGHLSAPALQASADIAHQDQRSLLEMLGINVEYADATLRHLSTLGASGRHKQNIERDLKTYLGQPSVPKPFHANIHVKIQKPRPGQSQISSEQVAFLLPHQYFHYLYHKRRALFEQIMLGGTPQNVHDFWLGVVKRRDPRIRYHEMIKRKNWITKAIPISYHGDAVPCLSIGKAGTKSLDVTSWQSLLASGQSSLLVKNFINGMFEQSKVKQADINTEKELGEVILWSLRALATGTWPTHNHRGEPYDPTSAEGLLADTDLADGYFCIMWLLKSDLDYVGNHLHLRHYGANEPCDLCPCNRDAPPSMWPSNFFADSGWIAAPHTVEQWRALYPNLPHWIFELGHVTHHNLEPDELHIIWLGTAMWFLGSVLWMLVFRILPNSATSNMTLLWEQISRCFSIMGTSSQYTSLSVASFCDPKKPNGHFPKLKGKGAEVKGLSLVMSKVWTDNVTLDNHEFKLIAEALEAQNSFACIIDDYASDLFLPPAKAAEFQHEIVRFLTNYSELCHIADARGDLLWNMTVKFH